MRRTTILVNIADFIEPAGMQEEYLKVLFTGVSGSGKTSSVIYGAPKPLLVFDVEKGTSQYAKVTKFDLFQNSNDPNFDETDPKNILWYTEQLLAAQRAGYELPYKSILLDSGTVLYDRVLDDHLKELRNDGKPNKKSLEPNEYRAPKRFFYEIIENLKKLNVHVFVTAHASDNYLKGSFMQIDPQNPVKPDCDKRLIHEMDVHYILSIHGKRRKAMLKKNRVVDAKGNNLLPDVIDNFNNFELIPMMVEMANKDKGFERKGNEIEEQNIIRTDGKLNQKIENIISLVEALQLSNEQAVEMMQRLSGKANPYELNEEESDKVLGQLKEMVEENSKAGE